MPSAFYTRLAETSLRLLTQYGKQVEFRDYGPAVYNTATGKSDRSYIPEDRMACKFPFGKGQTDFNGTTIQTNDQKCLIDVTGHEPASEDRVLFGDELFEVKAVQALAPAGDPVLYEMLIRRA